jgi:hypothetical protein
MAESAPTHHSFLQVDLPGVGFALFGATTSFKTATSPTEGGRNYCFVHAPDGGAPWPIEDIYAIDAEGGNVRALTNDGHSHDPPGRPTQSVCFLSMIRRCKQLRPYPNKDQKQYESINRSSYM